jgi:hypothetical protein
MLLDESKGKRDGATSQPTVLRQLNSRFEPELRLATRTLHVNVRPSLLSREEVEAQALCPKDGWTHGESLTLFTPRNLRRRPNASRKRRAPQTTYTALHDSSVRFTRRLAGDISPTEVMCLSLALEQALQVLRDVPCVSLVGLFKRRQS